MSGPGDVSLEVLIQIREELAGLNRTRAGLADTKREAAGLGEVLKQGLGIDVARRALDLLSNSMTSSVGEAFRLAEEIRDQSEALGISGEAYQVVRYELAQAGVEMSRFGLAISEQTQSLAAARSGAGAAAEAYKTLGLSVAELENLSPEQRAIAVARAVGNATDRTKAFEAAGAILGARGLPQLLNGLRTLATDGYDATALAAKNAGAVMSDSLAKQLDDAKQRVDNFQKFTLPVAAGSVLGAAQGVMNFVGATAGNMVNLLQGRPLGDFDYNPAAPAPKAAGPAGPAPRANADTILLARLAENDLAANGIKSNAMFTEREQRQALLPILKQQIELYDKLGVAKFGKDWQNTRTNLSRRAETGDLTEAEVTQLKELNDLEGKLRAAKVDRLQAVDTPLLQTYRQLADTQGVISSTLNGALNNGISTLSSGIWGAMTGTGKWSDTFRNLGNIAGSVLTDLMVKLLIIRPLLGAFGLNPDGTNIAVGPAKVVSGGGGQFLTNGPTNFTVGDNPGGVELVSVTPLSGIGQSSINGRALRMAGGGQALVGGRGQSGGGAPVTVNFNFATGVAGTVRAEIMGMVPELRAMAVDAVQDAHMRNGLRIG
jgi:hypothetical protein